jgi:hypothetical protein
MVAESPRSRYREPVDLGLAPSYAMLCLVQGALVLAPWKPWRLTRSRAAGLLIPLFLHLVNGLNLYFPSIPAIPTLFLAGPYFSENGMLTGFQKLKIYLYPSFIESDPVAAIPVAVKRPSTSCTSALTKTCGAVVQVISLP